MEQFKNLTSPLKLAGVTLKNRMLAAPTSLAELGEGEKYSPANINYYRLKAAGGCSVVTVGDVITDLDTGRSHPQQVGITDPAALPYLVGMADAIHSGGALASVEIDHGGALCPPGFIGGKNAKGPSGYVDEWGDTVEELTEKEIYALAEGFGEAAAAAKSAGFDMVMIHAGHGWLVHQFISTMFNRRTDKWGGSMENRMRFPLLVVEKVRQAVGRAFPIDIRISGSERTPGGYELDTGIEIAKALDGKVDLIHVSAGTQLDEYSAVLMHPGIFQKHGENSGLAREIRKHVKTPVCTVGAFSQPELMEEFLKSGGADCIAMGRALIADPFLPRKVARGSAQDITPCIRCGECQSGLIAQRVLRCTVNPCAGREDEFFRPVAKRSGKKRVLVAGGGPAGMQAALEAYEQGHEVTLCERRDRLGGALKFADSADFKVYMKNYRESQIKKVFDSGIDLRLNTPVDSELVGSVRPDALIIAVGSDPILLPVPGSDSPNIIMGADLEHDTKLADTVVVIGGGLIGCEEAVELARRGHRVTILEMQAELAPDCGRMHRLNLLHQVEAEGNITVATGMRCTKITESGVYASDEHGAEVFYEGESVVMAAGMRARTDEVDAIRGLVPDTYVIGDASRARKVMMAVRDAHDAVVNLGLIP